MKRLENFLQMCGGNANASIFNFKADASGWAVSNSPDFEDNTAAIGKFDRIAKQIAENLAEALLVALNGDRKWSQWLIEKGDAFLVGFEAK